MSGDAEVIRQALAEVGSDFGDRGSTRLSRLGEDAEAALDRLLQRLEKLEAAVVLSLGCIEDFVPRWEPLKIDVVSKLRAAITQEEERK